MSLRECQTDAINCIKDRYQKPGETNIQMCTGSGKSMIIRHASLLPDVSRCIIVFPSLLLVQQYYENHGKYYKNLKYLATEGTLTRITNIVSNVAKYLSESSWTILTTFASVPVIYSALNTTSVANLVIVDEAHHINGEVYNEAAENACDFIGHRVHFSATLPEGKDAHYKYSLLRGIADRVVRDFNIQLFICREGSTASFAEMINSIIDISIIPPKILVYTAEANTDGSSVKTFMETYGDIAAASGWWFDGIKSDTGNRNKLLRSFETSKAAATILVSCKTISEGVDLQGANVMLPWDPTTSVVDNIQRIGRVVRLYKKRDGSIADFQPPSTILIPVFLSADDYEGISGNKDAIHAMLEKQISEGEHGNFAPIVNVCTALKSELAEEDAELFNKLLYYPGRRPEPHVRIDGSLVNCVARSMKRDVDEVKGEVCAWLAENVSDDENDISDIASEESDDISDVVAEELDDTLIKKSTPLQLIDAITNTQNVAIIVKDNGTEEKFGDSAKVITIERNGDNYNVSKKKKDLSSGAKQVTKRFSASFSDECKIMLGLEEVDYDVNGVTSGLVITKLTSKVEYEAGEEAALERWKKRIADWEVYCKENKIDKFSRLPNSNSKNPIEKSIGEAICGYKKTLKGKGHQTHYESVDKLLIDSGYNNWLDIRSLEELTLEKWKNYIHRWEEICEHEKIDRFSRLPSKISKNLIEKTIGEAISGYKKALKGKGHQTHYESVDKLLINSGYHTWLDISSPEEIALRRWQNYIQQWEEICEHEKIDRFSRLPSKISKNLIEKTIGKAISHYKAALKGTSTNTYYESVNKLLIDSGYNNWLDVRSLEELALEKWQTYIHQWEEICEHEKIDRFSRLPNSRSENPIEKPIGAAICGYKNSLKGKGNNTQYESVTKLLLDSGYNNWLDVRSLEELALEKWQNYIQQWEEICEHEKIDRFSRLPNSRSKNSIEKPIGAAIGNYKNRLKGKGLGKYYESVNKLLIDSGYRHWLAPGIEPLTIETPPPEIIIKRRKASASEETESSTPAPTRKRKPIKIPTDEPIEHTGKKHIPSQLEVLHQKYKIMKSAKYYKHIASNPDAFATYHDIADAHDTRDAPENRPIEKIASILAKCKLSSRKKLIDLGCGRNRLRHHPAVAKLNWTSVDAVAVDETVVQADIGSLPFADGEFDVAIMSRSLWAQDHHTQLAEAHRILDAGGKLIICESFRRWWNSGTGENALVTAVTAAGFTVEVERGTAANDTDDVFQYIIAKKMDVVITI